MTSRSSAIRHLSTALLIIMSSISAVSQDNLSHPWYGKNIAYLGDSVTDPRNKAANTKYWKLLGEWLDTTPWVYAVSGRMWNDIPRQTDQLVTEHGDNVDAIMIFIGTNDFANAIPIGQWYNESDATVTAGLGRKKREITLRRRTLSTDSTTYRGRINRALSHLKDIYPGKQIVLLTPLHRGGFYLNDRNWQPTEEYANEAGEFVDAYVQAVKEAANVWSVPVIDLNAVSGLYPMSDQQASMFANPETDRLHPNDSGHRRIALTLLRQLSSLPGAF